MPTTKRIRGDAVAIQQVTRIAPPSAAGSIALIINGKSLKFAAWDIANIVATWNGTATTADPVAASSDFSEITASASGSNLILTADQAGRPFEVSVSVGGQNATNNTTDAAQLITLNNAPTGGTFTLTFAGQTTAAIAYNASAATVQTALQALATIGAGNVIVTGGSGGPWLATFAGTLADAAQALLTANAASLTGGNSALTVATLNDGQTPTNEQWKLTLNGTPTGGTFTLTVFGQTTGTIAYNAAAATVQTALAALSAVGAGNVACTGGALPGAFVTITFQGTLAGQKIGGLSGNGTGLTGGTLGGTVTETTPGVTGTNLKLDIAPALGYTPHTQAGEDGWTPVFVDGANTKYGTLIQWDMTAADVLNALAPIFGAANLIVTRNPAGTSYSPAPMGAYRVEFVNALAGTATVPLGVHWKLNFFHFIPIGTSGGNWDANFGPYLFQWPTGTNETQTVALAGAPTGGTFTLTFSGQTTAPSAYNASAATVEAALEALSNIGTGGLTVTGGALPGASVAITFDGNGLQTTNQPLMTIDVSGMKPGLDRTVAGVAGTYETQRLTITGSPWGGTLTLTLAAQTTAAIAYNATAAAVKTALEGLGAIGAGNVDCTGGPWPALPITASFVPAKGNLAQMTGTLSLNNGSVTIAEQTPGGVAIGVTEQTRSAGPSHWDDPTNWIPAGIPDSGDTVALDSGTAEILYGLQQRTTFTVDPITDFLTLASGRKTFQNGQVVQVRSTTALPGGLAAATNYYVISAGTSADNRLQLSATLNGAPVNITSAGTGTHTLAVALAALKAPSRWGGKLGLPIRTTDEVWEYRPLDLQLDCAAIVVGAGAPGNGTGRLNIDSDAAVVAVQVYDTAGGADGDAAFKWKGTAAGNTWEQYGGDAAVASREGEAATLANIRLRGGNLELGGAVNVAALDRTGGNFSAVAATVGGVVQIRG